MLSTRTEAMATGVSVIAVDFLDNGTKELAQSKCCMVNDPNGSPIASAILGLLDDEETRKQMRHNALSPARKCDWDIATDRMKGFMVAVVNGT